MIRPVQASDVAAISAVSTTMPTATRLSRSGWATAFSHSRFGLLPGKGTRPSSCARPNTTGMRINDSSLCTLRSGAPPASKKA